MKEKALLAEVPASSTATNHGESRQNKTDASNSCLVSQVNSEIFEVLLPLFLQYLFFTSVLSLNSGYYSAAQTPVKSPKTMRGKKTNSFTLGDLKEY